ncbi:MAG: sodium:solute symporter [Isosphaeraceae bacterium]
MNPIDVGIVVLYVLGCTILGARLSTGATGLKGYFLGEKNIPAWAVMISIVATETSTATFLSVPGVAYRGDFTYLQLPLGYIAGRLIVAFVLLPAYFRGEIYTAYQVLKERFGGTTRTTASILFLFTRVLADGLRLFLAAKVLQQITGWPIWASIVTLGLVTIVYTYLGGMKAVIWIDVIQFTIYIIGAMIALGILIRLLPGGWDELITFGKQAQKFRMFNFTTDLTIPYTFWAGMFGGMVLNTATHGADQMMVQRYLSARSERQAAGALIASGLVIFIQFAFFLFIGVSLAAFYQDFQPTRALGRDEEFAYFIVNYLPVGITGIVIAAIFSAAMGTLSGSLNSSASTTVNDLYRPLTRIEDEKHLLRVSRLLTAVWGAAQIGVALGATGLQDNVVNVALAIASFTTGIILGVFLLGILTTRVGETAALIGLLSGASAVTFARFGTPLAWPWFALVGSSTVFVVGYLASYVFPNTALPKPASEPHAVA